ncbi:hypothetical protein V6N12_000339 [Hibiscus sabdariffa]|uniref:Uncharacterized protein n=1 Tax=Hibiscus sabdariffa TaxID=183260 RepID=A0ABR2B4K4_9ROSI
MGDRTDCCFFHFFVSDDSFDSRWCEGRSRLHLGRRLVRLEGSLLGHRQPCRLRCQVWDDAHGSGGSFRCGKGSYYFSVLQDPAWCFASDDWYGVWGSFVSVFSDEADGLFVWFFAGKMEKNSDDGLTIWLFAGVMEGNSDDGSIVRGVVIGRSYMKALLWGTLKTRLGSVNLNEVLFGSLGCRIRVLLTGEMLVYFVGYGKTGVVGREEYGGLLSGGWLYDGWFEIRRLSEGCWVKDRWKVGRGVVCGLCFEGSLAMVAGVLRFGGSMDVATVVIVVRFAGSLDGFLVERGTFPWVCAVTGMAGGRIWPSGARGRLQCLVIRCVLDSQGLVRCVLDCRAKGLERGVLKIDDSDRVKRCVLLVVWRRVKRCIFGVHLTALKRAQLGIARCFLTYLERREMGGVGRGKQSGGNMQAGPRGGGRGQQGNVTHIRPRGPKRVLQGKYEVCTPVGSKKARFASSSLVIEDDGNLEVVSPLKTTSMVEAVEQPRREP